MLTFFHHKTEELAATIEAKKQEAIKAKEDIVDKGAYSIQEAKLKSEHDRRVAEAETKKQAVRRQLAEIRQEFQRLLKSNERAPAQLTLDRTEFNIEDQLREDIGNHLFKSYSLQLFFSKWNQYIDRSYLYMSAKIACVFLYVAVVLV